MLDLEVTGNLRLHPNYCLLILTAAEPLPDMLPGQFVEVKVEHSSTTFLRRPISINYIDREKNELWLLIQLIGDGTRRMAEYQTGDFINLLLPLGNSFTTDIPGGKGQRLLLIGGGVGTAPLLYLGEVLKKSGYQPEFLLGARSQGDVLQLEDFNKIGPVHITTEDGSLGEKGYVTNHSILRNAEYNRIYTCGPKPMMVAVAKYAAENTIPCEASLENTMACGFGACLCCVEDTQDGNLCVCTEGPIFNTEKLKWLN